MLSTSPKSIQTTGEDDFQRVLSPRKTKLITINDSEDDDDDDF